MSSFPGWVAIAALVIALGALALSLAEMRRRQRNDKEVRAFYEVNQGLRLSPDEGVLAPAQGKWERLIRESEADQKVTISEWSRGLSESLYQPPQVAVGEVAMKGDELLFELQGPDGHRWRLHLDGRVEGFPDGVTIVNHALPLVAQLIGKVKG